MSSLQTEPWRSEYPFQSHTLLVDGYRYHYLDEGTGPPLLMVHGNPTWSFYYRHLVQAFSPNYRVIVPDHLGCGLSDKPQDYNYTLANHIKNLSLLIGHLDLQDISLFVHDWGGPIGLGAAVQQPERFARCVLFNTAAFRDQTMPLRIRACRIPGLGSLGVRGFNAFAQAATVMATNRPERMTNEVKAGYLAPYHSWNQRIAIHRFVQDIPLNPRHPTFIKLQEIESQLPKLSHLPIQLIWGMKDWCFSPHFLKRWREEFFPEAEVLEIEDAGHYVIEDAHERIVPVVEKFFQKPTTKPSQSTTPAIEPWTLAPAADGSINVARRLTETARRMPDALAVVVPTGRDEHGRREYQKITFRELDQQSDAIARGLQEWGVTPGTKLVLMVRPSIEFISLTFALFKAGAVAVLIDPGMGIPNLLNCLDEIQPDGFVALGAVQAVRSLLQDRFPNAHFNVTVGKYQLWDGKTVAELQATPGTEPVLAATKPEDPAAIIFTSGSTGPPKGVLYRHGNFDAQVDQLREFFDIRPGEINLPGFPLFTLFDAAMGVTTIVPEINPSRPARLDPPRVIELIHDWQVTQAFGSPAIWNAIAKYCQQHQLRLPSLRRVLSAGAPVPPGLLFQFSQALSPEASIHTPYGATEALPVASISSQEVLGETAIQSNLGAGTCVGNKFPGIEWKIIRILDAPIATLDDAEELPQGEIGELIVSGAVVTTEYYQRPEATLKAKIQDGSRFWHRMGDVGYIDHQGRFWFCGRMSQRLETEHGTMFTVPCEAIFNDHPQVYRSALVGPGPRGKQRPVIVVEPLADQFPKRKADREALLNDLRQRALGYKHTRAIETFLIHPTFPVDVRHNAKIGREKLTLWAAEQWKL